MPIFKKYYFLIIVVALAVPGAVFGECKITDTNGRYVVVCSGKESSGNPPSVVSKPKMWKVANKENKARFESQAVIAMNEEEKRIMETNNKLDGYRSKRKPREKAGEKNGGGRSNPNS